MIYPFGIGISNDMVMFDDDSIEKMLHIGYQDEQAKEFNETLQSIMIEFFAEKNQ